MQGLSDDALAHKTVEFKERLDQGETLDDLLIESYAVVREAAWRVLGPAPLRRAADGWHGPALRLDRRDEDREGKTLVSTLPVYLNALDGRGVHMVTVNEYLATRDAEWMGRVHRWLGLTVGRIGADIDDAILKRAAYAADITYGTNSEFGFDYLRDNMARSRDLMAQRESRLRHRRRGRLHPHRRGPHAPHHLGAGRRGGAALLPVRLHRPHA